MLIICTEIQKIDTKMLYLQAIEEFDTGIGCQEARDYDE